MPNPAVRFLWSRAIAKGVKSGIVALIGLIGVAKLAVWGITIDQTALAAAVIGALGTLRNWLKQTKGMAWL